MTTSVSAALACVLAVAASVEGLVAAQVNEGWRVDFDDGTLGRAVEPCYVNRFEGRPEPERSSWQIEGGTASVSGRFDAGSARGAGDYVALEWRELNVSLTDFPILEMRFRVSDGAGRILVQGTYEYADGSRQTPYFYAGFEAPGQWTTLGTRLVADSSRPRRWTPRRLLNLHLWLMGDRPVRADFDWVRLRALGEREQEREDEWIALLADYEPVESQRMREFFPFGVYDAEPDSSSAHKMTHRMSFRLLSRNHLNFVMAGKSNAEAAEEMGVRIGLRMREAGHHFEQGGARAVIDWAGPIIDRVSDSPAVVRLFTTPRRWSALPLLEHS